MTIADEAGLRVAHAHLERRLAEEQGARRDAECRAERAEAASRRDQTMIGSLIAALALRDGISVAAERLRWIPTDTPPIHTIPASLSMEAT